MRKASGSDGSYFSVRMACTVRRDTFGMIDDGEEADVGRTKVGGSDLLFQPSLAANGEEAVRVMAGTRRLISPSIPRRSALGTQQSALPHLPAREPQRTFTPASARPCRRRSP